MIISLDTAAQRERARRRHERRWERRINIAIFVVASTISGFFAVVVALTGGAFAFVVVPMFVLTSVSATPRRASGDHAATSVHNPGWTATS